MFTNSLDFTYMNNYKALLACILNKKLQVPEAIYKLTGDKRLKEEAKVKLRFLHEDPTVYIFDTKTKKEIKCNDRFHAAKVLGVEHKGIHVYIDKNIKLKRRYFIYHEKENNYANY